MFYTCVERFDVTENLENFLVFKLVQKQELVRSDSVWHQH